MQGFLRFSGFVALLVLSVSNAFALGTVTTDGWNGSGNPPTWFSDPVDACKSKGFPGTTYVKVVDGVAWCYTTNWKGLPHDYGFHVSPAKQTSCPANSTKTGTSCACNDGFKENAAGDACEAPTPSDPCEDLADACAGSEGKSKRFSMPGYKVGMSIVCQPATDVSGTIALFPNCSKGCMGVVSGSNEFNRKADGKWVTFGSAKGNGSTCDPAIIDDLNAEKDPTYEPQEEPKLAETPDATCMNGQKGSVNGVTVCLPFSASSGVTETETKDNGDGTKTNSKTEVKCENGKCEVTKTSTTTNNTTNNTVSSSSTTTTVDKADYCSKNKTAGVCKDEKGEEEGKGKFGGSCSGGFTCEGDALQCAIAKEQHKRSCELHVNESPESKLYEASKGKTGKVTDDLPGNETIALTNRIDTSSALGAGYCPLRDINVDMFGYSKVLPLSDHCEKIGYVKIFFVSFCLLLGLWIVFGRK
ncbi:hypothetical protein [Comamonas sp. CMM02]|uniref:hypothetical protein n=1 Tax=Comamonas sp. CMM02 TaxID=2769307 RepID=UPI00178132E1|nr:hypothetical protein [Comamonas sp. CMM02]MBD9401008.1 hypothetical protein [Comamonas sp. CMM02]